MSESLTVSATRDPGRFRTPTGEIVSPPDGWVCLPPGDAGLTRRVKAAGPTWTVIERRGRKRFSRGVWAPAASIETLRSQLGQERADPAYERRRASDLRRRAAAQAAYVEAFRAEVLAFLDFSPPFADLARRLADAVTEHATPVGSGTVARTRRIAVGRRAEAAVVAWLRHQTTGYDHMKVARARGERRRVRRRLAAESRSLLDAHRLRAERHEPSACPLCRALARPGSEAG
jgi:hypothetical protein